jgi:hypothetical protein
VPEPELAGNPEGGFWCTRLPGTLTGYSAAHRTRDAELHSAGGPNVSPRESLGLLRKDSPQTTVEPTA